MTRAALPDRHLDLGCGASPRNPYRRGELHGVDIRALESTPQATFRQANAVTQPLPYDDDTFGSVSAYDFIEHVPRLLPRPDGVSTWFPFIQLMNEAWRVLAPGGRFYALTPAFPSPSAFVDPTHVNIITERTHEYFAGTAPQGRMYGFVGSFDALRVEWAVFADAQFAVLPDWRQKLRRENRRLRKRLTHLLWEFEAVKPAR